MKYTNPSFILCLIALILTVSSFIWPIPWQIPTILLSIAAILPRS